jgi:hypothetical protein
MIALTPQRSSGWLIFGTSISEHLPEFGPASDRAHLLLELSAELPFGCKYGLREESGLFIGAERPEPIDQDASSQIASIETCIHDSLARLAGSVETRPTAPLTPTTTKPPTTPSDVSAESDETPIDVASLCREAGWSFQQRAETSVVVDLAVPGSYVGALVESRASGIAVEANLVSPLPTARERRAALAALLLRANGAFRMARAVFRDPVTNPSDPSASGALLESPLSREATPSELDQALSSLTVAAGHCALEARLLAGDERMARTYLRGCRYRVEATHEFKTLRDQVGLESNHQEGEE